MKNAGLRPDPKVRVVHNGVDFSRFNLAPDQKRSEEVVTICGGSDPGRIFIKGVDYYLELARAMPGTNFLVVGPRGEALEKIMDQKPANVRIESWVEPEEMPKLLASCSIICQFSRYEAFGMALVEGMGCGCVPVGYRGSGVSEVIEGSPGVLINALDLTEGIAAINKAFELADRPGMAHLVRKSASDRFSLDRRREQLLQIINRPKTVA